jgi:hypothetical protein
MQCDIRLVASDAKLAFAHVRRGVLPDAHSHWTVPRTIGFARAAELFLTGRYMSATKPQRSAWRAKRCQPPKSSSPQEQWRATSPPTARRCRWPSRNACYGRRARSTRDESRRSRTRTYHHGDGPPRRARRRDGVPRAPPTALDAVSTARLARRSDGQGVRARGRGRRGAPASGGTKAKAET